MFAGSFSFLSIFNIYLLIETLLRRDKEFFLFPAYWFGLKPENIDRYSKTHLY